MLPYLLLSREDNASRQHDLRALFDAVRYIVKTGHQWRLMPHDLPPRPAAYQQMQSAFRTVHPDLEEASRILGATRLQALGHITAPLLRTSVIATWCFIFVGVIRELSAAIMLFTSQTKVVSVLIFDLNESGDLGAIAVLGIIMLVITFAVVILASRIPGFGGPVRLRAT